MKFCPYCGRQLNERSKFCPFCGKQSPVRKRAGTEESGATDRGGTVSVVRTGGQYRSRHLEPAAAVAGGAAASASRSSGAARRFAPPTHSLVGSYEQAGFGLRYGAWMFDFLITLIAMMTFTFVVTALSRVSVVGSNRDLLLVLGLTALLFALNFVVLAGYNGQSAGMRILGIRIIRVDGQPFTRKGAAMRHLVGYPLSLIAFFLGFLWMLWDPRQQGWHDKLAGTIVVMSR